MSAAHATSHIVQSLVVNLLIAGSKGAAAVLTGSGAMLAEALHSGADCGNQVLLLVGVRQSRRAPDASHPLGYGRALYFWSFMVALLLFSGGGVFSIYEGLHKVRHPEPVERVWIGLVILGVSLVLEGGATLSNVREIGKRRAGKPFFRYLRETKDSDLVVVFGENVAATIGLAFALVALALASVTGDGRWDGAGSVVIGVVLVAVAIFLAIEVQSLLLGESADREIDQAARKIAGDHPQLERILEVITVQQGPGEVLAALKVRFSPQLTSDAISKAINDFEASLRAARPEVRWLFIEPDLPEGDARKKA